MFYQELLQCRHLFLLQQLPVRCLPGLSFHLIHSRLRFCFSGTKIEEEELCVHLRLCIECNVLLERKLESEEGMETQDVSWRISTQGKE